MVTLLSIVQAQSGEAALRAAFSPFPPDTTFAIDPVPCVFSGLSLHPWFLTGGPALPYSDIIDDGDGAPAPVSRRATAGYLCPAGDGGWAVMVLDATAHLFEEAADLLLTLHPDFGR
jgi:hypothetical protein